MAASLMAAGSDSDQADEASNLPQFTQLLRRVDSGEARAVASELRSMRRQSNTWPDSERADYFNVLGYAQRKAGQFDAALAAYKAALAIAPGHLGANEYLGELYLQTGNLALAKQRLAVLARHCARCEEYIELKEAIQHHEQQSK